MGLDEVCMPPGPPKEDMTAGVWESKKFKSAKARTFLAGAVRCCIRCDSDVLPGLSNLMSISSPSWIVADEY
jgi:hypothetical protein